MIDEVINLNIITAILILVRPKQWIKNGFVFAPLIFSGRINNLDAFLEVAFAALLFCIASSAAYIVNDIHDIQNDRLHPVKSKIRPLAAGTLSVSIAINLLFFLYAILIFGWFLSKDIMFVIFIYLLINVAYTFVLKYQPVVDIFTIAIGFVLRVYAGATALNLTVSSWMFITTLSLSLFLGAIKRKQEIKQSGIGGRAVLKKYNPTLIDCYAQMSAIGALIFYSIFIISSKPELAITVPLVLFGLFRYWYVVEQMNGGESPTDVLLNDRLLSLTVILWIFVCIFVLWPKNI